MFADLQVLRRAASWRAILAAGIVLSGCDTKAQTGKPTPALTDQTLVRRWLLCVECFNGELAALTRGSRRDRMVPLLAEALKGPPATRRDNVRHQLEETYQQLALRAARQGRSLPLPLDLYVSHFLGNYNARYQSRAIVGLAAIGTPEADSVLRAIVQQVDSGVLTYRSDVLEELRRTTPSWLSITASEGRSCGIRTDGKSYCWGTNDFGELGDGTTERRVTPTLVAGNREFALIDARGRSHTCGVAADSIFCWGRNTRGELGDGSTNNHPLPTPVASSDTFVEVALGRHHSCGRTRTNRVYCWGVNHRGQLGDQTTDDRREPVAVAGNLRVRSIRAGLAHTCADSLNGRLYCWGANSEGQLGDRSTTHRYQPVRVASPLRFMSLSLGDSHGCGLRQAAPATPAVPLPMPATPAVVIPTPVVVTPATVVPAAVMSMGYCVGNGSSGQLGDGSTQSKDSLVAVAGGYRFMVISAGQGHTCGITLGTRRMLCWGSNAFGQLGDGSISERRRPVAVADSLHFAAVSAGPAHTCGITTRGAAYCWGFNGTGGLGDGTTTQRLTPTRVQDP